MKSFEQFLTEGRDAPLYHGCSLYNAEYNLRNNGIFAFTQYGRGVSLSRSKAFSSQWGPVLFELDQTKLIQNHKIKPYNFFGDPKVDPNPDTVARTKGSLYKKATFMNQFEEAVPGDIKPLDRYLTAIWIADYILDNAVNHGTDDDKVQLILSNPKYAGTYHRRPGQIF